MFLEKHCDFEASGHVAAAGHVASWTVWLRRCFLTWCGWAGSSLVFSQLTGASPVKGSNEIICWPQSLFPSQRGKLASVQRLKLKQFIFPTIFHFLETHLQKHSILSLCILQNNNNKKDVPPLYDRLWSSWKYLKIKILRLLKKNLGRIVLSRNHRVFPLKQNNFLGLYSPPLIKIRF